MYTLYPDVQITRRTRLHYLMNEHKEPVWTGAAIATALQYLFEQGEKSCLVDTGQRIVRIDISYETY